MSKQAWSDRGFFGFGAGFPGMGFGFGRSRFFESGELRLALLSLLGEGPKHGYQLMKEMQERSGGLYRASAGSVYPTLQQLEDEGMVEAEVQSGRRVYHLTDEGRKELERDPETVKRIWERAERYEDWGQTVHAMGPDVWPLLPTVGALAKASLRAAGRVGTDRVREILERTRSEVEKL